MPIIDKPSRVYAYDWIRRAERNGRRYFWEQGNIYNIGRSLNFLSNRFSMLKKKRKREKRMTNYIGRLGLLGWRWIKLIYGCPSVLRCYSGETVQNLWPTTELRSWACAKHTKRTLQTNESFVVKLIWHLMSMPLCLDRLENFA